MTTGQLLAMLDATVAVGVIMCLIAVVRKDNGCEREGGDD